MLIRLKIRPIVDCSLMLLEGTRKLIIDDNDTSALHACINCDACRDKLREALEVKHEEEDKNSKEDGKEGELPTQLCKNHPTQHNNTWIAECRINLVAGSFLYFSISFAQLLALMALVGCVWLLVWAVKMALVVV